MKRNAYTMIIILLTISTLILGCTNQDENQNQETTKIPENITVYGGSVGGVWSIFTEGISEAVRREYPGTLISAVSGTVAGNPISVDQNKTDFAIAESLTTLSAYEGTAPFDEKHENIRAVAAIIPVNVFQMVAPESAPFNSVEDVISNEMDIRYSAGEKNGLGDIISSSIFAAYEVTYDDIETNGGEVSFLSGSKTFELMADRRIDSVGKMVPILAGDIIEASATIDMKFIPIGQTAIDYLVDEYSLTPYTIDAGSYDFQTEDYLTVNAPTILITNTNMSEEVVYQVTESIYNQQNYLADVHNGFKQVNDETIVEVGEVPLHPGAEKFFKKKGLLE